MIQFCCPTCGLETNVDPQYAGQTGPCAGCGKPVTVPLADERPAYGGGSALARRSRLPWGMRTALVIAAASLLVLCLVFSVVQFGQPWIGQLQERAGRNRCLGNAEAIVRAMHAYHAENGTFPPAFSVDESGKPLHSWRVLLLPYLGPEAQALHQRIQLSKPWNRPENSIFQTQIPTVYTCPANPNFAVGDTSFCVVTGVGCAFQGSNVTQQVEIRDNPGETLLIIEVSDSGINWMQPVDVPREVLLAGLNSKQQGAAGSEHADGVVAIGLANGKAVMISDLTAPEELVGMATIAGGEPRPSTLVDSD